MVTEDLNKIPGNFLRLVGHGRAVAEWGNASMVNVHLPREIIRSSFNTIPDTKKIDGVTIRFVKKK